VEQISGDVVTHLPRLEAAQGFSRAMASESSEAVRNVDTMPGKSTVGMDTKEDGLSAYGRISEIIKHCENFETLRELGYRRERAMPY
jgi:hypothetical protein